MAQNVQHMVPVEMVGEMANSSAVAVSGWDIPMHSRDLVKHCKLVLGYQSNISKQNKLLIYAPQHFSQASWNLNVSLFRELILEHN